MSEKINEDQYLTKEFKDKYLASSKIVRKIAELELQDAVIKEEMKKIMRIWREREEYKDN